MTHDEESQQPRIIDRLLWAGLALVLVLAIAAGVYRLVARPVAERLPVLGTLPEFSLTERGGATVGSEQLRGSIWVADFIFTRCGGICPVLSASMETLQARRSELPTDGPDIRFVSFTVDPSHDTAEILNAYASRFNAKPEWMFLTGERDELYTLVRDGFRLAVAEASPDQEVDPGELVTHSDRLVLVDENMRVRAYHHGTEPDAVDAVMIDLARLLGERR